ncbi:hypothetical protein HII31_12849 [Pseudocercospora fuligena]|uniref:DUF2235 domain-containing protein n=1 Tax=Pseudocercospora fuligena TaxID=685502 RepID=A0A8H6R9K0_9PEZI|nr:hypothetical protein HII31_12849 [Pseudocercospora fuligena]
MEKKEVGSSPRSSIASSRAASLSSNLTNETLDTPSTNFQRMGDAGSNGNYVASQPSLPSAVPSPLPSIAPSEAIPAITSRRFVICVDGASYKPDDNSIPTNIYRIYTSIKNGKCVDRDTGITYNQEPLYYAGIGGADDVLSKDRLQAGVLGNPYQDQIRNIYEKCCELSGPHDEVVFFGFSRGAYVVRAVAGLLHRFGALISAGSPDFARNYKKLLKDSDNPSLSSASNLSLAHADSVSSLSTITTQELRPSPKIRFLGAFDTIKAVDDSHFDISFNSSIKHFRHALALHEDRRALQPEEVHPTEFYGTELRHQGRSFVQAWFIGSHGDMGGVAEKAGLGLYPLQWMILEANACGTWIDFEGKTPTKIRGLIEGPLEVVFPRSRNGEETIKSSFTAANGLVTTLQDLRIVHDQAKSRHMYGIKLHMRPGTIRMKKQRAPFDSNGYLRGYCDFAPQGTIVHPSVYLLLDEHINVALDTKEAKLQKHLEEWREKMLGIKNGHVNFGFWGEEESDASGELGAIRVLVCGNTGVGKSTLINKTFGVEVTTSSDRTRGIHDVKQEIKFDGRPDLIVHDSGGFEAGADAEFIAIEEFLKEKSGTEEIQDRLHVIWFCIEINSARTLQTATEKLFQAVSKYANDVPIVVVATKKDDFLDIEFSAKRKELKKNKQPFDEDLCDQYAADKLQERLESVRKEMQSVPGGRLDAIVAVSQDDEESIAFLSKTTSHCFDVDKVRLLYIRAQVTRIDLKIDMAMCEVMRRYKALVRTASGVSFSLAGSTIHRKNAATKVCKAIINCFGLPGVSADSAITALKKNVWTYIGVDPLVSIAEAINLFGYIGTGFAGGIPAWLVTGAISLPLVVPATCRLFLTMAADLMLVLIRAFKEATFRNSGQPQERDVQAAARIYRVRGYSAHIHKDIKKLIPRRNVAASYKFEAIQERLEGIIARYKDKLIDDMDMPDVKTMKIRGGAHDDDDDDDESTQPDSEYYKELTAMGRKAAELEGSTPAAELPASPVATRAELPTAEKPAELVGDTTRAELASNDPVRVELASPNDTKTRAELSSDKQSVPHIKEVLG